MATLLVFQDGSGDFTTLQAACDACHDNDSIVVGPGEYPEGAVLHQGAEDHPVVGITIQGAAGAVPVLQGSSDPHGQSTPLLLMCGDGFVLAGADVNHPIVLDGYAHEVAIECMVEAPPTVRFQDCRFLRCGIIDYLDTPAKVYCDRCEWIGIGSGALGFGAGGETTTTPEFHFTDCRATAWDDVAGAPTWLGTVVGTFCGSLVGTFDRCVFRCGGLFASSQPWASVPGTLSVRACVLMLDVRGGDAQMMLDNSTEDAFEAVEFLDCTICRVGDFGITDRVILVADTDPATLARYKFRNCLFGDFDENPNHATPWTALQTAIPGSGVHIDLDWCGFGPGTTWYSSYDLPDHCVAGSVSPFQDPSAADWRLKRRSWPLERGAPTDVPYDVTWQPFYVPPQLGACGVVPLGFVASSSPRWANVDLQFSDTLAPEDVPQDPALWQVESLDGGYPREVISVDVAGDVVVVAFAPGGRGGERIRVHVPSGLPIIGTWTTDVLAAEFPGTPVVGTIPGFSLVGGQQLPAGPFLDPVPADGLDHSGDLVYAVLASLFSDRLAEPDDVLPEVPGGGRPDRRGWWADAYAPDGDLMGSRLWELDRAVLTDATPRQVEEWAREALAWMKTDGVAAQVDAAASRSGATMALTVTITRAAGTTPLQLQFADLWAALSRYRNG